MQGNADAAEQQRRMQAAEEQEQMRANILLRILMPEARERLTRISMVRPDRGRALEDFLITAARSGQLRGSAPSGQLTESDLVSFLERASAQESAAKDTASKVRFQRRSALDDDDF